MENCVDIDFDSSEDLANMETLVSVIGIIGMMIFLMIGFCVLTISMILLVACLGFTALFGGNDRLEQNFRELPMEIY